ncbi:uncharacterized protein LOC142343235 isoform X2 [Convolutriloba macropyga]|uniref:uncharacterized protein LOC142343235 isoform X2 n=1 Tax=Convolutriloba macropyga TaxID=536237 RepID=UPI003F525146
MNEIKVKADYYGFKNQSTLFNTFRPDYPSKLIEYIIDYQDNRSKDQKILKPDGGVCFNSCALDLACGTGLFTRKLAPFFRQTFGTDLSEKQIRVAMENDEGSSKYAKFDACDFEGTFNHFSTLPKEVSMISVACAMHWLDFDRLAVKIIDHFRRGTPVVVAGYLPVQIMNQSILESDLFYDADLEIAGNVKGICFKSFIDNNTWNIFSSSNIFPSDTTKIHEL